jgi:hypothetical protein
VCNIDPTNNTCTEQPARSGDLVRLTGLEWIGHNLMGKIGLVTDTTNDVLLHCRVCHVLFENRIVKIHDYDLTIVSRARAHLCVTI